MSGFDFFISHRSRRITDVMGGYLPLLKKGEYEPDVAYKWIFDSGNIVKERKILTYQRVNQVASKTAKAVTTRKVELNVESNRGNLESILALNHKCAPDPLNDPTRCKFCNITLRWCFDAEIPIPLPHEITFFNYYNLFYPMAREDHNDLSSVAIDQLDNIILIRSYLFFVMDRRTGLGFRDLAISNLGKFPKKAAEKLGLDLKPVEKNVWHARPDQRFTKRKLQLFADFEGGNMDLFEYIGDDKISMLLRSDTNGHGFAEWFNFGVEAKETGTYIFSIYNFSRGDLPFSHGMKITTYDLSENSWSIAGKQIIFKENGVQIPENLDTEKTFEKAEWQNVKEKEEKEKFEAEIQAIRENPELAESEKEFLVEVKNKKKSYFTLSFSIKIEKGSRKFFSFSYPYNFTDLVYYLERQEELLFNKPVDYQEFNSDKKLIYIKNESISYQRKVLCGSRASLPVYLLEITSSNIANTDLLKKKEKKVIYIIARLRSRDSNSSYIMQGLINFLMSDSPQTTGLRELFIFKLVPMFNPDGVVLGNSFCNVGGSYLRKNWDKPSKDREPEIYHLKESIRNDQKHGEVLIFCEIATSLKKKNCFIDSYTKNEKISQFKWINSRLIAKIMKKTNFFSYGESRFCDSSVKIFKPRVSIAQDIKVRTCFTFKSSFLGYINPMKVQDNSPFHQADLQSLGTDIGYAFLEYTLILWNLYKRNLYEVKEDMEPPPNQLDSATVMKGSKPGKQDKNQKNNRSAAREVTQLQPPNRQADKTKTISPSNPIRTQTREKQRYMLSSMPLKRGFSSQPFENEDNKKFIIEMKKSPFYRQKRRLDDVFFNAVGKRFDVYKSYCNGMKQKWLDYFDEGEIPHTFFDSEDDEKPDFANLKPMYDSNQGSDSGNSKSGKEKKKKKPEHDKKDHKAKERKNKTKKVEKQPDPKPVKDSSSSRNNTKIREVTSKMTQSSDVSGLNKNYQNQKQINYFKRRQSWKGVADSRTRKIKEQLDKLENKKRRPSSSQAIVSHFKKKMQDGKSHSEEKSDGLDEKGFGSSDDEYGKLKRDDPSSDGHSKKGGKSLNSKDEDEIKMGNSSQKNDKSSSRSRIRGKHVKNLSENMLLNSGNKQEGPRSWYPLGASGFDIPDQSNMKNSGFLHSSGFSTNSKYSYKEFLKPPKNPFIKSHDEIVKEYSKIWKSQCTRRQSSVIKRSQNFEKLGEDNPIMKRNASDKYLSSRLDDPNPAAQQHRIARLSHRLTPLESEKKNIRSEEVTQNVLLSKVSIPPLESIENQEMSFFKRSELEEEQLLRELGVEHLGNKLPEKKIVIYDKEKFKNLPRYTGLESREQFERNKRKMNKSKVDFRNRLDNNLVNSMEYFNKTQKDIRALKKNQKLIEKLLVIDSSEQDLEKFKLLGVHLWTNQEIKDWMKSK